MVDVKPFFKPFKNSLAKKKKEKRKEKIAPHPIFHLRPRQSLKTLSRKIIITIIITVIGDLVEKN